MLIAAKVAGALVVVLGTLIIVNTAFLKSYVSFLAVDKRYYGIGICRMAMGIVLVLAARQAVQGAVAAVLGSLMLISGILVFAIGEEKIKALLNWYSDLSDLSIRILGLVVVVFGLLIVLSL